MPLLRRCPHWRERRTRTPPEWKKWTSGLTLIDCVCLLIDCNSPVQLFTSHNNMLCSEIIAEIAVFKLSLVAQCLQYDVATLRYQLLATTVAPFSGETGNFTYLDID